MKSDWKLLNTKPTINMFGNHMMIDNILVVGSLATIHFNAGQLSANIVRYLNPFVEMW